MPRLAPSSSSFDRPAFDPARLLQGWILLGIGVLLALPGASWNSHAIGWLPYWLVLAPAMSLTWLRRQSLWAQLRHYLGGRRRRPAARRVSPRRTRRARTELPRAA